MKLCVVLLSDLSFTMAAIIAEYVRSQSQGNFPWLTHWDFFQHLHGLTRPNKHQVRQRGLCHGSLEVIWDHLFLENMMAMVNTTQQESILSYSLFSITGLKTGFVKDGLPEMEDVLRSFRIAKNWIISAPLLGLKHSEVLLHACSILGLVWPGTYSG